MEMKMFQNHLDDIVERAAKTIPVKTIVLVEQSKTIIRKACEEYAKDVSELAKWHSDERRKAEAIISDLRAQLESEKHISKTALRQRDERERALRTKNKRSRFGTHRHCHPPLLPRL